MKTLRFLIFSLLASILVGRGQITNAGWYNTSQRSDPFSNLDLSAVPPTATSPQSESEGLLATTNPPAIAEAITPDLQALADSLQDNPVKIFNYVHDHIRYVLYFGSKKGAELTWLEKSGNDFDQSALLVAMLRAAGYTANEQFGWMGVPYDATNGTQNDLHHWLQLSLSNTNWNYTTNYLWNLFWNTRGYPTVNALNDNNTWLFQRVWVTADIGGTNYSLDPAFKVSEPVTGINLATATGASSNALWTVAGGVDTGNYTSNLNEAALRGTLTGYATNLLNYLQSNSPNASVQQITGGWQIVPATNTSLPTNLLFQTYTWNDPGVAVMPIVNWVNEPTNLMYFLEISYAATNYQCFVPELEGQRLALTFDQSGNADLWTNDTLVASNSTVGYQDIDYPGDTVVIISLIPPIGSWNTVSNTLVQTNLSDIIVPDDYQMTNATYALIYSFEPDWGWLQERENVLNAYLAEGYTNGSRQVLSETLNVMGLSWYLQSEYAGHLMESQMAVSQEFELRLGRMAQESGHGYYVDAYMQSAGFISSAGWDAVCNDEYNRFFNLFSYFSSGLEYGIIEQLQNTNLVGASTVKMLEIANTNDQAVFLACNTNWAGGDHVNQLVTHYSPTDKDTIGTLILSYGYYVLLPQNGSNFVAGTGSWAGYGMVAYQNNGANPSLVDFLVSGNYNGGYDSSSTATVNTPFVQQTGDTQPDANTQTPINTANPTEGDPVDTADGTFEVQHTDLSLGQGEPRGITLSRYYNGMLRYGNPAGLGYGWLHNYCVNASTVAAPQASLGGTTPAQAAPMLAAIAAVMGLYNDAQPDPKNWMVTDLIAKWATDQITKGGVSINLGKDLVQFIRQPNGTFTPPANCTMTLTQTNSAYTLQLRHGNRFNFNTNGLLNTIVDQYGNTLSVAYTNGLVKTVTDWKGRSLTFNYSGTPAELTSVSDGTRTVSYGYSTAGDLVSYTDPENKTSTYQYDTNHQITATMDAESRLVVTNVYNTLGRIVTQYTEGLTNKMWLVFWSGWQTMMQDPGGGQQVFSYDDQGRLVNQQDALGNLSQTVYDGQNHVIETLSPLNETNQFIYDGNNNLIETIDPLNNTNQFVHDANNDLIETIDARGNPTTFGYNTEFSLTGQTNGAGDYVNDTYNANGTLASRTDSGGTTYYGYDSTYGQLISIASPNGLGTNNFANNALGDVVTNTDARGFVTAFQYNLRRQLTNSIAPTNLVTGIAFDAVGNQASTTDARGNITSNTWSATRHVLATTLPTTPQGVPIVTNLYDNRDWLASSIDPLQHQTSVTNDLDGHLIAQTDPVQRTTTFSYDGDGRKLTSVNAANETNSQTWDARGDLIRLTDGAGHTSLRAYDQAGNQIILTNRNGNKWQFYFDKANRLTNTVTPLGHSTTVAFNHQGLPVTVTDPAANVTTLNYDAKGRLTNRTDSVATTLYRYDANDNRTNVTENNLTNAWTFDAYNRASSYRDIYGNLIQYRYDANGNLTNLIYPGNRNVFYAFDSNNRLTNVLDWSGRRTSLVYDLAGRLLTLTRPNGTTRTNYYDAAGELTNFTETTAIGFPIAIGQMSWDAAARMQWEFVAPLPPTNAMPTRTMTYDADNRLASVDGTDVTMDADGNLVSGPLTNDTFATYTYDARNRLLNVGGVTNAYDAMNNRVGQTYGTNTSIFVVNPVAKLPQMLMRIKNGVTNYYVYGAGLLYQITETATGTNTLTYHYDYRGSTIALTADNGNVTDRMAYSLYATMTSRAGTNDTPFLFNGRYGVQSDPNGLLYMRARYFSPFLCRFINPDPSGFGGGLNFYVYANGNPVSLLDPFGLNAAATGDTSLSWYQSNLATTTAADQEAIAIAQEQNDDTIGNTAEFISNLLQGMNQSLSLPPLPSGNVIDGTINLPFMPDGGGIVSGVEGIVDAAEGGTSFFDGTTYSSKVLQQMDSGAGEFHSFPESVTAFEDSGTVSTITGGDGQAYQMLGIPGSYQSAGGTWYDGSFQFIKNSSGVINHRLFLPSP